MQSGSAGLNTECVVCIHLVTTTAGLWGSLYGHCVRGVSPGAVTRGCKAWMEVSECKVFSVCLPHRTKLRVSMKLCSERLNSG